MAAFKFKLKISTPYHPVALKRFKPPNYAQFRYLFIFRAPFGLFISVEYITKLNNARKKCN
jgi:hypothetical protein